MNVVRLSIGIRGIYNEKKEPKYLLTYRINFQARNVDSQNESVVVLVDRFEEGDFHVAGKAFDCLDFDVTTGPRLDQNNR